MFEIADPTKPMMLAEGNTGRVFAIEVTEPFGQKVPRGVVYVRECYIQLFPRVMTLLRQSKRVTVTITGTPGIGKSVFGLFFIIEMVRRLLDCGASSEHPSDIGLGLNGLIVYEHVKEVTDRTTYYLIDSTKKIIKKQMVVPILELDDLRTLLVKDGPCAASDVRCSVLWVSSPRAGSFQKEVELGTKRFVLPPWTDDELVDCWQKGCAPEDLFNLPDSDAQRPREVMNDVYAVDPNLSDDEKKEAVLRRWAADLGPVARRVFDPAQAYEKLDDAMKTDLAKEDLQKLAEVAVSNDVSGSSRFKTSHRLLLMDPHPDLTKFQFIPSSTKIAGQILRKQFENDLKDAQSLMGKMSGAHHGLVFEPFAHFVLSRGGNFTIRNLETNAQSELQLAPREEQEVHNHELEGLYLAADKYYEPTDPTFAVIDSWTNTDMFQMTVSLSHPVKSTSKQFKALQGKGPNRIIFVVPKAIADNSPQQPLVLSNGKPPSGEGNPQGGWNDVGQFALGL